VSDKYWNRLAIRCSVPPLLVLSPLTLAACWFKVAKPAMRLKPTPTRMLACSPLRPSPAVKINGRADPFNTQILNVTMKRLALDAENISVSSSPAGIAEFHETTPPQGRRTARETDVPHATFAPMHYEPKYAYPLLIWLHGTAGNEQELRQLMPLVSMRNYVAVAPRGTSTDPRRPSRYGWRQASEQIETAEARISDCVALARRRFNINPSKIFLVGHGSGGTMAVRIAWNDPARFAGVVALNGPLPTRLRPLRRVNDLRRVPCFLSTTRDSRAYPPNRVCDDLRLLHAAGCTVALRQYPGGDGLTNNMLSDLDRWLMELVCGAAHTS
jgi:phospholipase/carboxylesterase